MRKTWLAIPLILALVILGQSSTPPSSALAYPAIYIEPASIINTELTPSKNFTISIKTNYTGADIWGWELTLTYNPIVLNGVKVVNGGLIVNQTHPATFGAGTFDNNAGKLSLTGCYFDVSPTKPVNVTSGPGTLANVTFHVVGTGDTPITLGTETRLIDGDGENIVDARLMPYNIGHGYFRNTAFAVVHDARVLSGTVNDTSLYVGRAVNISVTVKNEGNVRERFDVSIYYRVIQSNWLIYKATVELNGGATQAINVVWNTANSFVGTSNITVVASQLFNETDTADNQLVIAAVHIRILGDINADRVVDSKDYMLLIGVYPDPNPPPADPEADLDNDGTIDADDWMILVGNLGKKE